MPVIMQIEGWEATGFRCPDHNINFVDPAGDIYPISLLQMPNGTGKTTALQLLRATLSGGAADGGWSKQKIRTFAKLDNTRGEGKFAVHLRVNGRKVTLATVFSFVDGTVRYSTTFGVGIESGHNPPRAISRFLRPGFVEFFVFDGELAERLLSHEHTNAEQVIDDLFQLDLFTAIQSAATDYWNEKVRRKGPGEQKGLTQRRNRVFSLRTRLVSLRELQLRAKANYESVRSELTSQKSRFDAALQAKAAFGERIARADGELTSTKTGVRSAGRSLLAMLRSPEAVSSVFAAEMLTFKDSLDRVKLPESAAREFFEELAMENECICGRPLDASVRASIRERASQYLGSDDVALLNAIKGDVSVRLASDPLSPERRSAEQVEELRDASRKEMEARTARDLIQSEGVASDPRLEKAQQRINELERRAETARDEAEKYDSVDESAGDEQTYGIRVLAKRLETAEKLLAEMTETMEMKAKRDILQNLLGTIHGLARAGIGSAVCTDTNLRIAALMPDNRIRVERIDRCLILREQEGGSVGETLSVAYAFLSTLFNRTDHQLPFVVDSPANPIDLRVRSKVAELIPRLTNQFIAFTISSERQSFLEPLEQAATGTIQYLTLFRRGSDLDNSLGEHHYDESTDGVCVRGRSYFRGFHVDEEDTDAV